MYISYIYTCIFIYICMCMYTYIYTHHLQIWQIQLQCLGSFVGPLSLPHDGAVNCCTEAAGVKLAALGSFLLVRQLSNLTFCQNTYSFPSSHAGICSWPFFYTAAKAFHFKLHAILAHSNPATTRGDSRTSDSNRSLEESKGPRKTAVHPKL